MRTEQQFLRGPATAAVLKILEQGPQSSYQLVSRLRADCPDALALGEAALLGLNYYLEAQGLIAGTWSAASGVRRRTYTLTESGRKRLAEHVRHWRSLRGLFSGPSEEVAVESRNGEAAR